MEKISHKQLEQLLKLSDLWRRYDQVYSEWAQHHGFSTNAMTLIEEMLIRPEGVEPAEIADYLGIARQTMTATLDTLENKGLITRFPHVKDRRRKVVRFTSEGQKTAQKIVEKLHRWELDALSAIDETDRSAAFTTVKHFCDELEKGLMQEPLD